MSDVYIQVESGIIIGRYSRPQPGLGGNVFKVDSSAFNGKVSPFRYQNGTVSSDVAGLKSSIKKQVEAVYAGKVQEDYTFNGKVYQADAAARANIEAGLLAVLAGKTEIDWTAKDNSRSTLTAAQFKTLCSGLFDRGQALFVAMRAKKEAVDALGTEAALLAYDVNTGW